ncbi:MAG: universal stress protein [Rudaea sp.]
MKTRTILIPTDGSKASRRAVSIGLALAKSLGARVIALHVIPAFHTFTCRAQLLLSYGMTLSENTAPAYTTAATAGAEKILDRVNRAAHALGVKCSTVSVVDDVPARVIVEVSGERKCELVVMASHGYSGIERMLLGSETQHVLTHSTVPVLVCK